MGREVFLFIILTTGQRVPASGSVVLYYHLPVLSFVVVVNLTNEKMGPSFSVAYQSTFSIHTKNLTCHNLSKEISLFHPEFRPFLQ